MTTRVFIDGAAGTTGLEIAERLSARDDFALTILSEDARKDAAARRDALNACDVAILCLPDDAAREAVALIDNGTTRVIDASTAYRVADGWTYGFPELVGEKAVADARFVSNPGCYPTGFLGLVAPLVRAGLLPADHRYICHAVSGYSGGGKALIARYEEAGPPAFRAYGLTGGHKHLPEMARHAGLAEPPLFSPAVVPAYRGMIVEVPVPAGIVRKGASAADLRNELGAFFAVQPLVTVAPEDAVEGELLLDAKAAGWDAMELFVFGDAEATQVRLLARLDNLGKGASGAAVQNLNLMCGLPATSGLRIA